MRWLVTPSYFLLTAAAPVPAAPSVTELSNAVASVNDWRAMGLFFFAFLLLREAALAWKAIQDRKGQEKLAASIDRLTDRVAASELANIQHRANVEAKIGRVES